MQVTPATIEAQHSSKLEAGASSGAVNAVIAAPGLRALSIGGNMNSSELPAVVDAPLSATGKREEVTKLIDGNRIVRTTTTRLVRDSQGRTRVEHVFPTPNGFRGAWPSVIQISDPISGESFMLNMLQKTASMMPPSEPSSVLQAPVAAPPMAPQLSTPLLGFGFVGTMSQTQLKETSLGEKMIDGIRAVGKRVDYTVPANTIGNQKPLKVQMEQWFSPDLGVVVLSTQRCSAGVENTYKLEQIDRSEPDSSLFTIPADFTKEDFSQRFQGFRMLKPEPAEPSN
jgi:hypothetical protein